MHFLSSTLSLSAVSDVLPLVFQRFTPHVDNPAFRNKRGLVGGCRVDTPTHEPNRDATFKLDAPHLQSQGPITHLTLLTSNHDLDVASSPAPSIPLATMLGRIPTACLGHQTRGIALRSANRPFAHWPILRPLQHPSAAPAPYRAWSSSSRRSAALPETPPPKVPPPPRSALARAKSVLKWSAFLGASSVAGVLLIGGAIFVHDAFTYTDRHVDRVPVNPLALHPETGGPKDLPIARVLVEDEEDEENKKLSLKPRLVILGGGWGVRFSFLSGRLRC